MARGAWQPRSNEQSQSQCHRSLYDYRTYGGRPLAETKEAHGLIKGLEEVFGELGARWSTLVRGER